MSHYTVLVIGDNIDEQLKPFDENTDDPNYQVFADIEPESREEYATQSNEFVLMDDGTYLSRYNEKFRVETGPFSREYCPPEDRIQTVPLNVVYPTFEAFMSDWKGEKPNEEGKWGYWHNPNSKWDWYQIGGRWTGFFKLKEGVTGAVGRPGLMTPQAEAGWADQVRKGDIDFEGMRDQASKRAFERFDRWVRLLGLPPGSEPWVTSPWKTFRQIVEENPEARAEELRAIYYAQTIPQAFQKAGEDRKSLPEDLRDLAVWGDADDFALTQDEYALRARHAAASTFAVLMDGKWYERGEMGWWGIVTGDSKDQWYPKFAELLDSISDDTMLTVVDCHI